VELSGSCLEGAVSEEEQELLRQLATPAASSQVNLASTPRQHTALVQGLGSDVISQAYTHGRLLLFLASHVISQAYTHADLSGLYPCAAWV